MMNKRIIIQYIWLLLLISTQAVAQSSGGNFVVPRETIDNGGGRSSDSSFIVTGTIGQHDASAESITGGDFIVNGGFWTSGTEVDSGDGDIIFKDGFELMAIMPEYNDQ